MSESKESTFTPMPMPRSGQELSVERLRERLRDIETYTQKDVLSIYGDMNERVPMLVRLALEHLGDDRNRKLLVILDTPGGSVEAVKTIVNTLRNFYPDEVHFLVPIKAMSAGTVLVMSGDVVQMDYFSRLGPIDPQILRKDEYIPGFSYLRKYWQMQDRAKEGELTVVDEMMIRQLDLGELDQIELAAELSISLIKDWLPKYKFKDWQVSDEKKLARAEEIAQKLNDPGKWFVHSHGIHKDVLEKDLHLKIDDYGQDKELKSLIWQYFWPMMEYVNANDLSDYFVQSRKFL